MILVFHILPSGRISRLYRFSERNKFPVLELLGGVMESGFDMVGCQLGEVLIGSDLFRWHPRFKEFQDLPYHDSRSRKAWLAMADVGINLDQVIK